MRTSRADCGRPARALVRGVTSGCRTSRYPALHAAGRSVPVRVGCESGAPARLPPAPSGCRPDQPQHVKIFARWADERVPGNGRDHSWGIGGTGVASAQHFVDSGTTVHAFWPTRRRHPCGGVQGQTCARWTSAGSQLKAELTSLGHRDEEYRPGFRPRHRSETDDRGPGPAGSRGNVPAD